MDLSYLDESNFSESQTVRKTAVTSENGVVAAQHRLAAATGAAVLSQGGNAVDAAVATSFVLGVAEPWMSGPGGGGNMVIHWAETGETSVIDFNMRSPAGLDPADYPLAPGTSSDLFVWPSVLEDRNLKGAFSVAVPGTVDGMGVAHGRHGTMPWSALLAPAIELARKGPHIDWYTSLMISTSAAVLAEDPTARDIYLRDGQPPVGAWTAVSGDRLDFSVMAETLSAVAEGGPREFYEGETARKIAHDMEKAGGSLRLTDLENYRSKETAPLEFSYGDATLYLTRELTAGSTMAVALEALASARGDAREQTPSGDYYRKLAGVLRDANETRLAVMGDVDGGRTQTCTTSFSVVDGAGNLVVVTQTLLSIFGSKLVLPQSGLLMNNGILWFDPTPGHPNTIEPGKRCLTNICPVIGVHDGRMFGLGASGGRKIMPAVLQLTSFLTDFGMTLEDAFHQGRIDTSMAESVIADAALGPDVLDALGDAYPTVATKRTVYPYSFACPSGVLRHGRENQGMTEIMSPWGDAVAAR